jgi:hypothetical protein
MKSKTIDDTCKALQIILDYNKIEPFIIMSDSDSSFLGDKFQKLLKSRDIELTPVVVDDHRALGIIDRFARTLKTRLTKLFLAENNSNWVDHLADIMYSYNNNSNRGILNYTPNQVLTDKTAQDKIADLNIEKLEHNQQINDKQDIKSGDHIRLYIDNPMRKGTEPNYTSKIFEVKSKNGKKILLTNGKTILDHNLIKINDSNYTDNNLITTGDNSQNINVIEDTNKENKINRKLKKDGLTRPTYDELHTERTTRKKQIDFKKLNGGR